MQRSATLAAYCKDITCALCGAKERLWSTRGTLQVLSGYRFTRTPRDIPEDQDITGTVMFCSRYLDTRPLPPDSGMLETRVRRCHECGYCASDLSTSTPGAEAVVKSEEYRRQLDDKTTGPDTPPGKYEPHPDLVNSFLCKSLLDISANDRAAATWSLIHAAWACDDRADLADAAMTCRSKAADMLMSAECNGQAVGQEDGVSTAILVDLLRRSGRMDDARKVIAERRLTAPDQIIISILDFQEMLIDRGNTNRQTVAVAVRGDVNPDVSGVENTTDLELAITGNFGDTGRDHIAETVSFYSMDMNLKVYQQKWESGELVISEFQREHVWNIVRASKLIESFLLRLPVPDVFLYDERTNGKLLVIDGRQRILSAVRFFQGHFHEREFRLRKVATKWEGKTFQELSEYDQARLLDTVLPTTIVQQPSPDHRMSLFHISERLNNGGVELSPMEIRKCVYSGDYFRLLEKLNGNRSWRAIVGSDSHEKGLRDVELILRFFAMRDGWKTYEKPMKSFLNRFIVGALTLSEASVMQAGRMFELTCADVVRQLGVRPFHLGEALNPALLDSVMVMMSLAPEKGVTDCDERYEDLLADEAFIWTVTTRSSSDALMVGQRFERAQIIMLGVGGDYGLRSRD